LPWATSSRHRTRENSEVNPDLQALVVDRKTLEIVGNIQPAGVNGPDREMATDSKGNLNIAQTTAGLQKLTFKGMSPGKPLKRPHQGLARSG